MPPFTVATSVVARSPSATTRAPTSIKMNVCRSRSSRRPTVRVARPATAARWATSCACKTAMPGGTIPRLHRSLRQQPTPTTASTPPSCLLKPHYSRTSPLQKARQLPCKTKPCNGTVSRKAASNTTSWRTATPPHNGRHSTNTYVRRRSTPSPRAGNASPPCLPTNAPRCNTARPSPRP